MRAAIVCAFAAALPLLAGCEDAGGDWLAHGEGFAAPAPVAVAAAPATPVSDRRAVAVEESSERFCARMAKERAADTDQQGLDDGEDGFRQKVYDKAYADCLTWQRRAVIDERRDGGSAY